MQSQASWRPACPQLPVLVAAHGQHGALLAPGGGPRAVLRGLLSEFRELAFQVPVTSACPFHPHWGPGPSSRPCLLTSPRWLRV